MFLDFLMFCRIFFSPQVKQWVIITDKHDVYELLYKLLNYLRLRTLGI